MASEDRDNSRRFFVEGLPAQPGQVVPLPPSEAHHALHVLRLKAGAPVELFDGRGGRAAGVIAEAARGAAGAEVRQLLPPRPRRGPIIHLGFAVPKGKRLDWLLEKATELGAAGLWPVRFQRSVAGAEGLSGPGRRRWLAHCIAAAKQCGLDFLPQLQEPLGLKDFLTRHRGHLGIVGDAAPTAVAMIDALAGWTSGRQVCLLVGPEGGLAAAERALAQAAGFVAARLGATTLRVETAAIAMLSSVLALCTPAPPADR